MPDTRTLQPIQKAVGILGRIPPEWRLSRCLPRFATSILVYVPGFLPIHGAVQFHLCHCSLPTCLAKLLSTFRVLQSPFAMSAVCKCGRIEVLRERPTLQYHSLGRLPLSAMQFALIVPFILREAAKLKTKKRQ